jgi:hypothetical protein
MYAFSLPNLRFFLFGKEMEWDWKKSEKCWCFSERIRNAVGIYNANYHELNMNCSRMIHELINDKFVSN